MTMTQMLNILVIEDDSVARSLMAKHLKGHRIEFAHDATTGRAKLERTNPDLCFIDLMLNGKDPDTGLGLIPIAASKGVYSIVMTGHDREDFVERAYELGCNDFYVKGNEDASICRILARFSQSAAEGDEALFSERFVTTDPKTRSSISEALKFAASDLPLLILGPSGTGKTSLAALLHERSGRNGDFIAINCAAHNEDLLEAELFGYNRGSFTGASENRRGKLSLADQGTLFLDEIGNMSLAMQAKLLKAIEERRFYPLGSEVPVESSFRIISATLEDPEKLLADGMLRIDFFQRLQGKTVRLKPLSERPGDLCPLITHFSKGGKRFCFTPEAKQALRDHAWPGNIRELKRMVELLAAGGHGKIDAPEVCLILDAKPHTPADEFLTNEQYQFVKENGLNRALDKLVEEAIRRSLAENQGSPRKVLADIGVSRRRLYDALKGNGTQT